ncbi:3-isopropylmalate dehydratase large subunit [Rhodococcoides kyotonense]|uniref:3-isopropylmalate dehydratase large subunit n=1 Tax=Rhodococcoides kyotonense TaxID=398843 RepID=A0A239NGC8_9NOCA|nr:3-isopropylmalate dehydratase large subunit [Rhodococcus kyotonensis]SNT53358.1 3-isopropylmalate/(R)-2-methylmalate dehydratase large subunit [Rhodococcus kyotonensis]
MARTLAQKVWDAHIVRRTDGEPDLLYIDMHLLHEVNTPQAFDGLRASGRSVRRPELTIGVEDHNTPTIAIDKVISDPAAREQVSLMRKNCAEFGIELFRLGEEHQGIVHIVGPELGLSHPGSTIVCCDSHTATQGAFGALAFGIGTSQVEHVLATQTLPIAPLKNMAVTVNGSLPAGVTAKDLILAIIARVGTAGGQGHVIEYRGQAIRELSMEGRMTVCNMSVEAGSRAGMIAPDETTFAYLKGRPAAPTGAEWDREVEHWRQFFTDEDATFDKELVIDAAALTPVVTWGTTPAQSVPLGEPVPHPDSIDDPNERAAVERAISYMDVVPGQPVRGLPIDVVFVGSCTNSRIEDLREVAKVLDGRTVASGVDLMIVPGSMKVRQQAIDEGLEAIFRRAGTGLRFAGCSMCAALNEDRLSPGQRAASTNNRNFEGRQGKGSRTHIVSPAVAAASAVAGRLVSPADLS